jgi:hypothetical protein
VQLMWRAHRPLSIQSYPFNLNACGAAVNSVNSDNRLAAACGRPACGRMRPFVVLRTALSSLVVERDMMECHHIM